MWEQLELSFGAEGIPEVVISGARYRLEPHKSRNCAGCAFDQGGECTMPVLPYSEADILCLWHEDAVWKKISQN